MKMEIVVLSSGSTTTIRCLWMVSFMSLYMSQSCLADHDQFNFNLGRHFSRKICPGCTMKFELQPFFRDSPVSESMHLSASSNPGRNGKKNWASKMYLSVSAAALVLIAVSTTWHMRTRDALFEVAEEQENIRETGLNESGEGRSGSDSPDSLQREKQAVVQHRPVFLLNVKRKFKKIFSLETKIRNQVSTENKNENQVEFQGLPSFRLDVILEATQQFSYDRILGKGSFGPVYKGQLGDGKLVAVKRHSRSAAFGDQLIDFRNEATIIPKLQHKNVVRLFGYCTERNERLLIYELMLKGSLEHVLFGSSMGIKLPEWKARKNIINGIARGLLYLHEDSRLKILHRDIKPGNILLDENMNPKISDFGLAIIFDEDHEIEVDRIAGTFGYMAPEYIKHSQLSIKTDVYCFGIVLLEIITGKKNLTFITEQDMNLPEYIWKLWCEGQAFIIVDPTLEQPIYYCIEIMRFIHIGLLCIQEDPTDRPTISCVVVMLASNDVNLPQPTRPAFLRCSSSSFQYSSTEDISVNEGSI